MRKLLISLGVFDGKGASGGSVGAAVTNVKLSSTEAFAEEHWKNAFMSGNAPRPEEATVGWLEKIFNLLDNWKKTATETADTTGEAAGVGLRAAAGDPIGAGIEAARGIDPWLTRERFWIDPRTW